MILGAFFAAQKTHSPIKRGFQLYERENEKQRQKKRKEICKKLHSVKC
jgi:hypothetical protein